MKYDVYAIREDGTEEYVCTTYGANEEGAARAVKAVHPNDTRNYVARKSTQPSST